MLIIQGATAIPAQKIGVDQNKNIYIIAVISLYPIETICQVHGFQP